MVDFNAVDTSAGAATGAPVLAYLATFGISVSTATSIFPVIELYPFWSW